MSDAPNNGVGPEGAILFAAYAPSIVEEAGAFGAGVPFRTAGQPER